MSITLEANGINYDGFTSVKVVRSFTNLANAFSFNAVSSQNIAFPIEVGNSCVVFVEGTPVITGFIEKISISYSEDSHSILVEGRDRTCDVIDSTIDDKIIYKPPITLRQVIVNVLKVLGISNIGIIENVSIKPFSVAEIEAGKIGNTFFSFLQDLCKLRQVVLSTDGKGNIVLDQASKTQISTVLLHKFNNNTNNIKSSSSTFDFTERFGTYKGFSQGNPVAYIDVPQTAQQITNRRGKTSQDPAVRSSRQFSFVSEKSTSDQDLQNRTIWEANIRRAKSKVYNCRVQGFTAEKDGIVWKPNILVQVDDDFANTHGVFLIKDVSYTFAIDGGSITDLTLITKDAFTLQAEQDARNSRANTQGKGFVV